MRMPFNTCARRFELPTPWSVAKCSIQLSYTHILKDIVLNNDTNYTMLFHNCQLNISLFFILFTAAWNSADSMNYYRRI